MADAGLDDFSGGALVSNVVNRVEDITTELFDDVGQGVSGAEVEADAQEAEFGGQRNEPASPTARERGKGGGEGDADDNEEDDDEDQVDVILDIPGKSRGTSQPQKRLNPNKRLVNTTPTSKQPTVGMFGEKGVPAPYTGSKNHPNVPNFKSAFDIDIEDLDDKPWRKPGANLSDWFNYGFTEEAFREYANRQRQIRDEVTLQSKIAVYSDSTPTIAVPSHPPSSFAPRDLYPNGPPRPMQATPLPPQGMPIQSQGMPIPPPGPQNWRPPMVQGPILPGQNMAMPPFPMSQNRQYGMESAPGSMGWQHQLPPGHIKMGSMRPTPPGSRPNDGIVDLVGGGGSEGEMIDLSGAHSYESHARTSDLRDSRTEPSRNRESDHHRERSDQRSDQRSDRDRDRDREYRSRGDERQSRYRDRSRSPEKKRRK